MPGLVFDLCSFSVTFQFYRETPMDKGLAAGFLLRQFYVIYYYYINKFRNRLFYKWYIPTIVYFTKEKKEKL